MVGGGQEGRRVSQAIQPSHKEGLARGLSQAFTYVFELQKTAIQVYGRAPTWTIAQWTSNISRGIWQSSFSSGLVFHTYFSVYHTVAATHLSSLAGPIASLVTSGLKIPIGNCMRVVQASPKLAPTIFHAGLAISRNRGFGGLYSGYFVSLLEDIIEMDVRIRLYGAGISLFSPLNTADYQQDHRAVQGPIVGFGVGAVAGAVAAALTTPFDTYRAQLAFQASNSKTRQSGVQILASLCGPTASAKPAATIRARSRGVQMRAISTGIKAALFYGILEGLRDSV